MARLWVLVLGLAACAVPTNVAPTEVRWYRYAVDVQSGDTRYVEPLEATVAEGRRYRVERDARGRIVRVATFIAVRKVAETAYRFEGDGAAPAGYDYWAADGERTVKVDIHRDPHGRRTRQEFFLLDGRLANYRTRAYHDGHVESVHYTGEGKRESRTLLYVSADGAVTRARWYPGNESTYYDTEFDERTGLATGSRKYRQGVLEGSSRRTYDAGGLLTRTVDYDRNGTRFGVTDFAEGLKVTSRDRASGAVHEVRFAHDAKRRTREARHYHDGRHVCTLVYERLPSGRVLRTVARGPNGDVWAEYPDVYVEYVERNGEAVDRPGVGVIHRKGPWWPGPGEPEA